jgi:hypothetical protein
MISKRNGKYTTHGNEWRIEFINGSSITAYPSDILNDALRLESLSLHGCTVDEATAFQDPDVLWNVILNRITMPPPPLAQKLGITNTARVLGAAKYTFQPIYKQKNGKGGLVQMIIKRMAEWNPETMPYPEYIFNSFNMDEHLPQDDECLVCGGKTINLGMQEDGKEYVECQKCGYVKPAWRRFFKTTLQRMMDAKSLMNKRLWRMRWGGKWQDTSDSVYNPQKLDESYQYDVQIEQSRPAGQQNAIYAIGVDIGTGQDSKHSVSAVVVVKILPPDPRIHLVYARKYGCSLTELSGYIYLLWEKFQPIIINIDPGGGGVWLVDKDHLGSRKKQLNRGKGIVEEETTPLAMLDDISNEYSAKVLQLFTPNCFMIKNSLGTMVAQDHLINWAHETISGLFENNRIVVPMLAKGDNNIWTNERQLIKDDIDEAIDGFGEIGIAQDADGGYIITKNGFFEYYPKPDLAYGATYAISGLLIMTHPEQLLGDVGEGFAILSDTMNSVASGRVSTGYNSPFAVVS